MGFLKARLIVSPQSLPRPPGCVPDHSHGLRCEELCTLKGGDVHQREGVLYLRVEGKGDKVRYLPLAVLAPRLMTAYLKEAGHSEDLKGPLFRPVKNNRTRILAKPLHPVSVYQDRLLLDARVVDVPMAYNPTFVMLSFLNPYFSIAFKMTCAARTAREHKTPESNKSVP
jgi:integrase